MYLYFRIGNGQPREPALCQLYRLTFPINSARCARGNSSHTLGDDLRYFHSVGLFMCCVYDFTNNNNNNALSASEMTKIYSYFTFTDVYCTWRRCREQCYQHIYSPTRQKDREVYNDLTMREKLLSVIKHAKKSSALQLWHSFSPSGNNRARPLRAGARVVSVMSCPLRPPSSSCLIRSIGAAVRPRICPRPLHIYPFPGYGQGLMLSLIVYLVL